jgi:FlaA1/EpsC-like NDP-sugar epimerase
LRNRYFLLADAFLFTASTVAAFALRFEGFAWGPEYSRAALLYALISIPLKLVIAYRTGLYERLWRHAGVLELERLILASSLMAFLCFVLGAWLLPAAGLTAGRLPLSVLLLDALLTAVLLAFPRLAVRLFSRRPLRRPLANGRRVIIAGAGSAGEIIAKELMGTPPARPAPDRLRRRRSAQARQAHAGPAGAGPALAAAQPRRAARRGRSRHRDATGPWRCRASGPSGCAAGRRQGAYGAGAFELLSGRLTTSALREVQIEDLLRREPIQTDLQQVRGLATGETVLVTGAGGSIGSELCRQLAKLNPARLVLVGHGENSIFDILHELERLAPELPVSPVIADVRNRERLAEVFARYRPYSVFHAAAHKHVPLMEANPGEAVTNNVLGTKNVAELAAEFGAEHFVLISTDKAVRPTNVMGASKRVAEQLVQSIAETQKKNFVAVRFGNVLGSRGSVVPTFLRQIRDGSPITITHPEMRRYFMTIPEAVQLVLQAGALGKGGEVFVLDMGQPVKIVDLANDLIRLSGLEPGVDIEIKFTGTRPGEKLYEELFFNSENAAPTSHPKVLRARNATLAPGIGIIVDRMLIDARSGASDEEIRALLRRLVPDYDPAVAPGTRPAVVRPAVAVVQRSA